MFINMNEVFANMQNQQMQQMQQNMKICIDITKDVEIGPSPWEKHLAEVERQKKLPVAVDKEEKTI